MKNIFRYIIIGYALCCWGWSGYAQNFPPVFSQQKFSKVNYNPSAITPDNYMNAALFARHQWTGFEGAPNSQMLNLSGFEKSINSGFSATVSSDIYGRSYSLNAKLGYAYFIHLGKRNYMSLGLSAGFLFKNFRGSTIITDQLGDPEIELVDDVDFKPDFDFGLSFMLSDFSFGLSVMHLPSFLYKEKDYFTPIPAYFLYLQYDSKIGQHYRLVPQAYAYYVQNRFQFEVDLTAHFFDIFWFGAGYRYEESVIFMAGFTIQNLFTIGYSYDMGMGKFKTYHSGSHEIMLHLNLKTNNKTNEVMEKPRYFE